MQAQAIGLFENEFVETQCRVAKNAPRSPLKCIGGKSRLAKKIISLFPAHVCYCEIFGGAGHILFAKERSSVEILNDINGELVNFFSVLARYPQWFEYKYRWALYSRQIFEEYKAQDVTKLGDEDRAWRFFYLNRCAHGGIMDKNKNAPYFGTSKIASNSNNKTFFNVIPFLKKAHLRLQGVIIENLTWQKCIDIYDTPQTLFYLDPPYYNAENYYGRNIFSRDDFQKIADRLSNVKGKFLLSINDTPEIREIFGNFEIKNELNVLYSLNYDNGKAEIKNNEHNCKPELLITNY